MEFVDALKKAENMCSGRKSCITCKLHKANADPLYSCPVLAITQDFGVENFVNIIEEKKPSVDWSKVAIDTPILVWNERGGETKCKRYFAKYENEKVFAWYDGRTSWNADGEIVGWRYGELAEVESK